MQLSQKEKIKICVDIATRLKNFEGQNGAVNLFQEILQTLKKIFNDYINGDTYFKGTLDFIEIGKTIEYHLPLTSNHKELFVIKM